MDFLGKTAKEYVSLRDISITPWWYEHTACYLSIMTGKEKEEVKDFLKWGVKEGKINFNDPMMKVFRKDEHRDRFKALMPFSGFVDEVSQRQLIMAGTLTCYLPSFMMMSELAGYTEFRFNERKRIKREGQIAKANGDKETAVLKGNLQNLKKTNINSISGGLTIGSTPIVNRSGHSTLTSTCRTVTAFSNANTERLLGGKRYFPDGPSVLENIVSIISSVDEAYYKDIIEKFNLHYITETELFEALKSSFKKYWRSKYWEEKIKVFCAKLTPLQRTIYLYMGDLLHLCKYNEAFVRNMVTEIRAYKDQPWFTQEQTDEEMKNIDEFYTMLVAMCVSEYMGGNSIFDKAHRDKDYYGFIGSTSHYIRSVLTKYREYFEAFWITIFVPAETARFPAVIRENVPGGDTDSTLYHVMNWTKWYHQGDVRVNNDSKVTSQIFIYLLSMLVRHSLAIASANMGMEEKNIFTKKMKNEFFFDTFGTTNRTKHYLCVISACEGLNYKKPELEIKGVGLKNSKVKAEIMDGFNKYAMETMIKISKCEDLYLREFIDHVARIEAEIFKSIVKGDMDHLSSREIKVKETYAIPMSSDYAHYELWQAIFAPKYGEAPELPYGAVRVSMNIPNRTALFGWLDTLEDQALANRFKDWIEETGRKSLASILLPHEVIARTGIPEELKSIIDFRKIIYASTEPYYIFGEALGVYKTNKKLTNMFLDERLGFLEESEAKLFSGELRNQLTEMLEKSKRFGVDYEAWDKEVNEDEDFEDEEELEEITEEDFEE